MARDVGIIRICIIHGGVGGVEGAMRGRVGMLALVALAVELLLGMGFIVGGPGVRAVGLEKIMQGQVEVPSISSLKIFNSSTRQLMPVGPHGSI